MSRVPQQSSEAYTRDVSDLMRIRRRVLEGKAKRFTDARKKRVIAHLTDLVSLFLESDNGKGAHA